MPKGGGVHGSRIGKMYVELDLDAGLYEKSKKNLRKEAEKVVKHHESMFSKLQKGWVDLAAKVYLFKQAYYAALNLGGIAQGWAKLSGAQQIAEQQMRQAMITSGRFSQQAYEDNLKLAKSIQNITGVADEAVIQGQKMLLSFTKIPEELMPRVTKAMVDLSSFTGRTMEQSAKIFGKASLGMTGELRRLAIPIQKTTFEMKGFEGVLEEVEHHVKDQVLAIRQGYGAYKALADQYKELKERAGDFINALLIDTGIIEKAITKLQEWNAELIVMKDSGQLGDIAAEWSKTGIYAIADITNAAEDFYWFLKGFDSVFDPFSERIKEIKTDIEIIAKTLTGALVGALVGGPKGMLFGGAVGFNFDRIMEVYDKIKNIMGPGMASTFITPYRQDQLAIAEKHIAEYEQKLAGAAQSPEQVLEYQKQLNAYYARRKELLDALNEGSQDNIEKVLGDDPQKTEQNIHKISDALYVLGDSIKNYRKAWKTAEDQARRHMGIPYGSYLPGFDPLPVNIRTEDEERAFNLAKKMSQTLQGGIVDGIVNGFENVDYRSLGKTLARNFASSFIEGISKDTTDKLTDKLFGESGFLNTTKIGGMPLGDMLGAGALGYGMGGIGGALGSMGGMWAGSQLLTTGIFAKGGALAGLGGPIGMVAGGLLGGAFGDLFGGGDKGPSIYDIMKQQADQAWQEKELSFAQSMTETISSAISAGFMAAYESQEYQTFIDALKGDLGGSVTEMFDKLMMAEALTPLMKLFEPMFSLIEQRADPDVAKAVEFMKYRENKIEQERNQPQLLVNSLRHWLSPNAWDVFSYGGKTFTWEQWSTLAERAGISTGQIMGAAPTPEELANTLADLEKPFNSVTEALHQVKDTLGLNTDALKDNTDALIGEVESFLRDLTVGAYAPVTSLEGMQAEYEKLYKSAYFDPDAFSEFASFTKSGYLDYMKAYGGYDQAVAGVVSDVQNIDWYKEAKAQQPVYVENDIQVFIGTEEVENILVKSLTTNPETVAKVENIARRVHV